MSPIIVIRPLELGDADAYRAIRLEALRTDAYAFSASLDEDLALSPAEIAAKTMPAPPGITFGAFAGRDLIGIASYVPKTTRKERHKGMMVGVHLLPGWRARGLGRALVRHVIDHARKLGVILQCIATVENEAAGRLYHSLGFVTYGIEKDSLFVDGRYLDEELLALDLRQG